MQPTDPDQFTEQAWDAIVKSQEVARRFNNQKLEVEHLILALLEQEKGLTLSILEQAEIDISRLQKHIETFANKQPKCANVEQLYLGRSLDIMLDRAKAYCQSWDDKYISVKHLWMGFAEDQRIGLQCLGSFNIDSQDLEQAIKSVPETDKVTEKDQKSDPNPFTDQAWDAIVKSQEFARRFKNQNIEVEHIILALLEQEKGLTLRILEQAKIDIPRLQKYIETFANGQPKSANVEQLYLGRNLDIMLDRAKAYCQSWNDKYISVEHLWMGFAEDQRIGLQCLGSFNIDSQDLEQAIKSVRETQ